MIVRHSPGARRITLGADKGYDAAAFVADLRELNVTPHIAQNISGRALRHRRPHHAAPRLCGEPAEAKAYRGAVRLGQDDRRARTAHAARCQKLGFKFTLTMAGYNLIRLPKLIEATA